MPGSAELRPPFTAYADGTQPLPMQLMRTEWPEVPRRELTPEEAVRRGLAYIRSQYGQTLTGYADHTA